MVWWPLPISPRPGGACWSVENTLPGYLHEVVERFATCEALAAYHSDGMIER